MTLPIPSAICTVNGNSISLSGTSGINVTGGSTITIALANTSGVSSWYISATNSDDITYSNGNLLSVNNSKVITAFSATFVVPTVSSGGRGAALQFTSIVNQNQSNQNQITFGVWVLNSIGTRLFFGNESNESNATVGCAADLNTLEMANFTFGGDLMVTGTGIQKVVGIDGYSISGSLVTNDILQFNGTNWIPTTTPSLTPTLNLPILNNGSPNQVVVTNASKQLITFDGYATAATPNTFVIRDGYGDGYFATVGLSSLSASSLVATDSLSNLTTSVSNISPLFTNLTLSGLTANKVVCTNASNQLITFDGYATAATPNTFVIRDGYGDGYFATVGLSSLSASGLVATDANNNLTSSIASLSPSITGLTLSGLSASQAVVTNGSKALISLAYTTAATPTTLVERDANGDGYFVDINCSALSASSLVSTDGNKNLSSSTSGLSPTFTALTLSSTLSATTITATAAGSTIAPQITTSSGNALYIEPASSSTSSGVGNFLYLYGGQETGTTSTGGNVFISAGTGTSALGHVSLVSADVPVSTAGLLSINSSSQIVTTNTPSITSLTLAGTLTGVTSLTLSGNITPGTATTIQPASASTGSNLTVASGAGTGAAGGLLNLVGGASSHQASQGGTVEIQGGANTSGSSSASNIGGDILLYPGAGGTGGSAGVIGLFGSVTPGSTRGAGVLLIANASVAPAGTPSGGGYLYVSGGALYWLGPNSSGTPQKIGT